MEHQEKKQINIIGIIKNLSFVDKIKSVIVFLLFIIILIILISNKKNHISKDVLDEDNIISDNIIFEETIDEEIKNFITSYFDARINLRYDIIFKSFNKEFKNDLRDKEEQEIVNAIKYENSYVMSYDDIKIYKTKGINENDFVLLITYDLALSYSNEKLPEILICYITKTNDKIYFNDDINVGISKYLNSISKTKFVKDLYEQVKDEIEKKLKGNEELKLTYNTLRQYNMNQNINFEPEEIKTDSLDPIKDSKKIKELIDTNKERIKNRQNNKG